VSEPQSRRCEKESDEPPEIGNGTRVRPETRKDYWWAQDQAAGDSRTRESVRLERCGSDSNYLVGEALEVDCAALDRTPLENGLIPEGWVVLHTFAECEPAQSARSETALRSAVQTPWEQHRASSVPVMKEDYRR
jgi:hypothetical protein